MGVRLKWFVQGMASHWVGTKQSELDCERVDGFVLLSFVLLFGSCCPSFKVNADRIAQTQ